MTDNAYLRVCPCMCACARAREGPLQSRDHVAVSPRESEREGPLILSFILTLTTAIMLISHLLAPMTPSPSLVAVVIRSHVLLLT